MAAGNGESLSAATIDQLCDQFEAALHSESVPNIDEWLARASNASLKLLSELAVLELDYALRHGHTVTAANYLQRFPQLRSEPQLALRLVATEYQAVLALEGAPPNDFAQRYPDLAQRDEWRTGPWPIPTRAAPTVADDSEYPFLESSSEPGYLGQLGPYRIVALLGKGGMGFVFRAEEVALERQVAIKVMRPEVANKAKAIERFLREGRAAAKIKSDYIVTIYASGEANGVPYLVMEYMNGMTLEDWLQHRTNKPAPEAVAKVAHDVLQALAVAHDKGLTHRDIKPSNLWVEQPSGRIKVLDFGLTRDTNAQHQLTHEGDIIGTPAYMAPEQAAGQPVDHRADLFSLGVVLYRMLAGCSPFQRTSVLGTLTALATETPPPIAFHAPHLPPPLAALIDRLVNKAIDQRPASARAALSELEGLAQALPIGESLTEQRHQPVLVSGVETIPQKTPEWPIPVPRSSAVIRRSYRWLFVGGLLLLLIPVAVGVTRYGGDNSAMDRGDTLAQSAPHQEPDLPSPTFTNSIGMEFIRVPQGKFLMGGGGGQAGSEEVLVANDFYLGKYEVTQEEWFKVMKLNPSLFSRMGGEQQKVALIDELQLQRFPVESVSWDHCQEFIAKLNQQENDQPWRYTLPTEAQWEYACRGGPARTATEHSYYYYFDQPTNTMSPELGNYFHDDHLNRTCKVGSYPANRLGFHDMHGNVWEWCNDLEHKNSTKRALRGGSIGYDYASCRAISRTSHEPAECSLSWGLRLARVPK